MSGRTRARTTPTRAPARTPRSAAPPTVGNQALLAMLAGDLEAHDAADHYDGGASTLAAMDALSATDGTPGGSGSFLEAAHAAVYGERSAPGGSARSAHGTAETTTGPTLAEALGGESVLGTGLEAPRPDDVEAPEAEVAPPSSLPDLHPSVTRDGEASWSRDAGLAASASRTSRRSLGGTDHVTQTLGLAHADRKTSGRAAHTRQLTDGDTKTTTSSAADASYDAENGVVVSADRRRTQVVTSGTQTVTRERGIAASHEGALTEAKVHRSHQVVDGKNSSRRSEHATLGLHDAHGVVGAIAASRSATTDDGLATSSRALSIGRDDEGRLAFAAEARRRHGDDTDHEGRRLAATVEAGEATLSHTSELAYTEAGEDGARITSARTRAAHVTEDSAALSQTRARTRADADSKTTRSETVRGGWHGEHGVIGTLSSASTATRTDGLRDDARSMALSRDSKGQVRFDAKASRRLGTETDHESRSVQASFHEGKGSVGRTSTATYTDLEGHRVTEGATSGVSASADGVALDHAVHRQVVDGDTTSASRRSYSLGLGEDGPTGSLESRRSTAIADAGTSTRTGRVAYDGEHVRASFGHEHEWGMDAHNRERRTASVGASDEGVSLSTTNNAAWEADGARNRTSSEHTLQIGADGVKAGTSRSRTRVDQETGTRTTTSYGGSVNAAEGQISGNASLSSTSKTGTTKSVSASGMVDLDEHGRLEGASARVGARWGPVHGSADGRFRVQLAEPVRDGERWIVGYRREVGGGVSGGGQRKSGHGASVGLTGSHVETGQRSFATEAAARRFYERHELGDTGVSERADDAFALREGEQRTATDAVGVTAGGQLRLGGLVDVGASGGVSHQNTQTLARSGDGVALTDTDTDTVQGGVSAGAGGVSLTASTSHAVIAGRRIQFDDTPAGRRAYETYQQTGRLPSRGGGFRVLSRTTGTQDTDGTGVRALGASASTSSTVRDTTTRNADGSTVERTTGTETDAVSVPLLGSVSHSTSLTATEVEDGEGRTARGFTVTSAVNDTSANDANGGLAAATGARREGLRDLGESAGRYSVTSAFTDAQMRSFVRHVRSRRYRPHDLHMINSDAGVVLRRALRGSRDPDVERRALAQFVADGGEAALAQIRDHLGDGAVDHHITLEGDDFLDGLAGHQRRVRRTDDLVRRAGRSRNPTRVLHHIRILVADLERRGAAIGNPQRYPDLPRRTRAMEVDRNAALLRRLQAARRTAEERVLALERRGEEEASEQESAAEREAAPARTGHQAELIRVNRQWDTAATAFRAAETTVEQHRWVHNGAYAFQRSAREDLGSSGMLFDGSERSAYVRADAAYDRGRSLYNRARDAKNRAGRQGPDAAREAVAAVRGAIRDLERATRAFAAASEGYAGIRRRNPDPGYWQGYAHERRADARRNG